MKRLMIRLMIILVAAATCCTAHAWADTVAGEEDTVLVTWRDLRITRGDYEAALRAIPEQDRFEFQLDMRRITPVSYTHLRAHETRHDLVCRLLLEKKKKN